MAPGTPLTKDPGYALRMSSFVAELRRYVGGFFTNWSSSDLPYGQRLALTLKNRVRARWHGCCGNHGQPGC
jgi:hypothetical protein